ncbi:BgTH12-02443 [Blumeria graminis f. sp. triticale]|uniref:BgTH12-02443 n=1 Tax=Blumeria graminis f. sp. triticale TaxID=1689686 RepID=A0A9W4D128_BLUGR|nr:BgTH12-02443 [Blumeria graminis f. sp. triticale]
MLPYIDSTFQYASTILGATPDEIKLITTFFLSFPLAGLLRCIPHNKPHWKNLFNISVSLFYLVGLFELWTGLRTLFISSAFAYVAAKHLKRSSMPWIVLAFVMGHMSINHITRQLINDPGLVDITGAQMILVIKLSSFAWNVADGRIADKNLSSAQREKAIRQLPGILDFTGYVLFFPSLHAGPAFDYMDYKRWLENTVINAPNDKDYAAKTGQKKNKHPQSLVPALRKGASGIIWILMFMKLSAVYYPDFYLGDEYLALGFLRRVWNLHMLIFTSRLKYYGVWALSEGACILAGYGYDGIDPITGKASWNRLRHVDPIGVETAQNTRAYLGSWNINTSNWLRNYIYLRVTPPGKKPGFWASMATFATSALWHGFYPGYYFTFILASFVQTAAKKCRRYFRPFFLDPQTSNPTVLKPYYDILSFLVTQATFSFVTAPFVFLTLDSSLKIWSGLYFYGVIGTALSILFFESPATEYLERKLAIRAGTKKPIISRTKSSESASEPVIGIPAIQEEKIKDLLQDIKMDVTKN